MIATMQENVENYQGVDALPPFDLFSWFFVVPGALVVLFAAAARPRRGGGDPAVTGPQTAPETPSP